MVTLGIKVTVGSERLLWGIKCSLLEQIVSIKYRVVMWARFIRRYSDCLRFGLSVVRIPMEGGIFRTSRGRSASPPSALYNG